MGNIVSKVVSLHGFYRNKKGLQTKDVSGKIDDCHITCTRGNNFLKLCKKDTLIRFKSDVLKISNETGKFLIIDQ